MRTPTRRPARRVLLTATAAVPITLGLSACGPIDITPQRLEASIATVFPNYYVQQQVMLGKPAVVAAALGAKASCDKGGPSIADKGAGNDWICLVDWTDPVAGLHYTDADPKNGASKFELKVSSNGCYIAGGSTKTFGPIQIQAPDGTYVTNPVFEFDGCFNVYDHNTALTRGVIPTPPPPTPTPSPTPTASPSPTPSPTALPCAPATTPDAAPAPTSPALTPAPPTPQNDCIPSAIETTTSGGAVPVLAPSTPPLTDASGPSGSASPSPSPTTTP